MSKIPPIADDYIRLAQHAWFVLELAGEVERIFYTHPQLAAEFRLDDLCRRLARLQAELDRLI